MPAGGQALHDIGALLGRFAASDALTAGQRRVVADLSSCRPPALGGRLEQCSAGGLVSMRHPWGQTLTLHPHVHVLASGGGLSCNRRGAVDDEPCWRWCRRDFFLPVRVLSRLFRGKFLAGLRQALASEEQPEELSSWLAELSGQEWVVYSQPPAAGASVVLK
jgi:putative transposase